MLHSFFRAHQRCYIWLEDIFNPCYERFLLTGSVHEYFETLTDRLEEHAFIHMNRNIVIEDVIEGVRETILHAKSWAL